MLRWMTLLLFAAAAAVKDRQSFCIPNALLAAGAANGCLLRFGGEGLTGMPDVLLGALLPLLICGGLFAASMLGAGDVKLMMAVGIYLGPVRVCQVMLDALLIGAGLSAVILLRPGLAAKRGRYLLRYVQKLAEGHAEAYVDMEAVIVKGKEEPHLLHFSVPVLLAVVYEAWLPMCSLL